MRIHRGFHLPGTDGCALTIGNFDGVHRGHQAMLALLASEARHRGVPSCALTFEPHPRDHFARQAGRPELAPPRLQSVCRRRGRIRFEPGWIELLLPLEAVDTSIRRLGLDLDPGWLPWLACVLRIRYE